MYLFANPVTSSSQVGASLNTLAALQQQNPGLGFGQSLDQGTVAPFSSRGPTADGRIKPDLVAPGMPIFSAYGQPGVTAASDCQMDAQQVGLGRPWTSVCVRTNLLLQTRSSNLGDAFLIKLFSPHRLFGHSS